ncbi:glutamyl aminopeptidase-like [Physella acuta]|uniref:glutamyl aminopeptidase-like n=1 Tax=Physella acuta TaxID=109671 RepID=UPI0027DC28A3|nr:glutamyl aminopeptidase-like [Physella acuta]
MVALPEFEWGGMENWGLITFKESTILYSPEVSPLTANEDVAQTVCHEISHMWFGNIVTMDWWNDLWLNEGFASYIEYVGVALKEPDWEILTKFLDKYYFLAMKIDSKVGTHPIVMDVQTTTDFTQSFDEIMYYKGSSIIRMLKSMMGDDLFYSGVANYLKKFQWGNAKTDDLWNSLSDVDHRHDVKHIMDTWILQDGFPFINVTFTRDNSGKTLVTASQSRFLGNPTAVVEASSSPLGYKWFVELTYKTSAGLSGTQSMDMNDTTFTLDLDIENDMTWVKFNTDQMGYYIVLYPPEMWRKLLNYLLTTPVDDWTLSASDRAGLLNDAFSLANAGKLSYELPLELMAYLDREGDYVVWSTAIKSGINPISQMLYTPQWKNFVKNISQSVIEKLGFEDVGTNTERLLRNMLWNLAVSSNYTPVIENLSSKFRGWLDNGTSVTPNQKHTVYTVGMMFAGTAQDWDVIWQKYLVEPSPHEKDLLMYALATTRQTSRVDKLLGYLKDEVGIKRQDFATVTQILGMNSVANPMLWDWIRKNYQFFIDRFTIDDLRFGEVVYDTVKLYSTREKLQEVKDFFAQYPDAGASEGHRMLAIDSIEKNIYWAEHFKPVIVDWLERRHL